MEAYRASRYAGAVLNLRSRITPIVNNGAT